MTIITKLKMWFRGEGGYSGISKPKYTKVIPPARSMTDVDQKLSIHEQHLNERFNLSKLDQESAESSKQVNDLLESVRKCILEYTPSPLLVSNTIAVEARPLITILNDVSDTDGCLIIKGSIITLVNDVLRNALCQDIDINALLKEGNVELLKLFPRATIAKVLRCFKMRQLGQPLKIEIRNVIYDVYISEFVKDGICYRKVRIHNLVNHIM